MSNDAHQGPAVGAKQANDFYGKRGTLIVALLLVVMVLGVFHPVLSNDFIGYDDPDYVTENEHVKPGLTWAGITWAFGQLHGTSTYWHPVTWISHMVDCQLFGLNPVGHHLMSLLFHALNAVLVFVVFRRMTGAFWRCAILAALFALHPLQVDTVAWASERKNLLSALFWLLTMWAYACYAGKSAVSLQRSVVRDRTTGNGPRTTDHASRFPFHVSGWYLLALLFFALGLMCKPVLVTLPFVLLLVDYWPLERFADRSSQSAVHSPPSTFHVSRSTLLRLVGEKVPFLMLAALSSLVTVLGHEEMGALAQWPLKVRVENALVSYVSYLGKVIWPAHLAVFYPCAGVWPVGVVGGCALLLMAISGVAILSVRRRPYLFVGWFWFVGVLVPFIGLIQAGAQAMADRFAYVPLLGLFVGLIWGIHELTRGGRYQAGAAWVMTAMALLACAGVTRRQISYWKDTETLFRHALLVTKDNYGAHHALGMALDRQGHLNEAIAEYRATLRAKSDYVLAYNNVGVDLAAQGRTDEAMEQFRTALRLNPKYADPYNNIGMILDKQGRDDEARVQFQEAVRLNPNFANAHFNLGLVLGRKGLTDEAAREFRRTLELKPNDVEAHNNLGVMLERKGRLEEAAQHYLRAVQLNPAYPSAHYNLGVACAEAGHLPEAINEFREALRLKPDYPAARTNLALALTLQRSREAAPTGARKP